MLFLFCSARPLVFFSELGAEQDDSNKPHQLQRVTAVLPKARWLGYLAGVLSCEKLPSFLLWLLCSRSSRNPFGSSPRTQCSFSFYEDGFLDGVHNRSMTTLGGKKRGHNEKKTTSPFLLFIRCCASMIRSPGSSLPRSRLSCEPSATNAGRGRWSLSLRSSSRR